MQAVGRSKFVEARSDQDCTITSRERSDAVNDGGGHTDKSRAGEYVNGSVDRLTRAGLYQSSERCSTTINGRVTLDDAVVEALATN
jgi:hypothetical protein